MGARGPFSRPGSLRGPGEPTPASQPARDKVDSHTTFDALSKVRECNPDDDSLHYGQRFVDGFPRSCLAPTPTDTANCMNIDLLPFSAFALESSGASARAASEGQTLTLRLGLARGPRGEDTATSGTVSVEPGETVPLHVLRAAVLPAPDTAITLTF